MEPEMMASTFPRRLLLTGLMALSLPAWCDVGAAKYQYEKHNYAAALQQTQALADAGDGDAQVFLAVMYSEGKAMPQDYAQAADWYWKAANAGNIAAQLALSKVYAEGKGVPQDDDLADYWKWQAAQARTEIEKGKLEKELTEQQKVATGTQKYVPPTINMDACKAPSYPRTGYGYHHSGTIRLLFMVQPNGKVLETSIVEKSDWPELARDYLNSYSKSCTFKPATNRGAPVMGVYQLQIAWSIDP